MKKLSASPAFTVPILLFVAACSTMPKDDFNYPLRPHDITEGPPPSGLQGASTDLRRNNKLSTLSQQVIFDYASADLNASSKEALDQIAEEMKKSSSSFQKIRISGFTDARGYPSRNLDLSQRRADNVRKYLISKGVPSDKLESIGMGSAGYDDPRSNNMTSDRRVEFEIVQ
ncbi:OmpA family protein [Bdellovibrio svalbardensis]|uniref:OmpA family protein n=1 Tax=Bdellovibrio svalbardensis TaxID=2972972 RepID=A0ABT6DMJ2_9BACT|nr:OmpA family protein [Bdellovibrio svalbardensis]MDG0817144.1 OmpA family protein [Bdellovibrio svalbardensis]